MRLRDTGDRMSAVPKQRQPRRVIYTEVEHEIDEWDDEDLIAELVRRKKEPPYGSTGADIEQMFIAMKFGNKERALDLLREYLMAVTGRILP